ncbi:hypothetical protein BD779DRAFT_176144 [Infundibulicybe gibba]|nr:hypothetical protein BD779DRAFT_176144 [Infundibulicybe gibba]
MSNLSPIPQNSAASVQGPLVCRQFQSWVIGCSQIFLTKLLGYLFNWGLYGTLSVQVYLYYLAFPSDRRLTRYLVLGLYLVETLQTALITHDAFMTFVVDYGNLPTLRNAQLEGLSTPMICAIVSCTVQLFFTYRIFILSKSKLLVSVICLIALTQGGAGIAAGVQVLQIDDWSKIRLEAFVSCTIWLVGAAVCDILIAITMCYCLSRSETGLRSTHVLISKLIRLTIETGTVTATVATIDIALFLGFPHNNYHRVPALILAKLYSNTLMVTLNSRLYIADGRATRMLSVELGSGTDWNIRSSGFQHQMDQDQDRQDDTRHIEVIVVQRDDESNDSGACSTSWLEMKAVTFADGSIEREGDFVA